MKEHAPILAESTATGIGAAIGAAIAVGGYLWTSRTNRTDSTSHLVTAAIALSDRYGAADERCQEQLAAFAIRIEELTAMVDECNAKHARAEAALIAAGIPVN